MRRAVLLVERLLWILAMIEVSGHVLQLLPQRAAEGDVDLLESAADAKHRYAGRNRARDQRQRGVVAVRIMQRAALAGLAAVMARLDIRRAAHEQQAIKSIEQLLQTEFTPDRRHDQRQAAGHVQHRSQVLLAGKVVRLLTNHAPVCRNSDYRTLRSHDGKMHRRRACMDIQPRQRSRCVA